MFFGDSKRTRKSKIIKKVTFIKIGKNFKEPGTTENNKNE
jgi:hypothetical protein